MTVFARLQDFHDPAPPPSDEITEVTDLPGYTDGFNAGRAAADVTAAEATAAISRSLDDLQFSFAEAQVALLQSLEPFLAALRDVLLPTILPPAFKAELLQVLKKAAEADTSKPVCLRINPETADQLQPVLDNLGADRFKVVPDERLQAHEALVDSALGNSSLDMGDLALRVTDILDGIISESRISLEQPGKGKLNAGK